MTRVSAHRLKRAICLLYGWGGLALIGFGEPARHLSMVMGNGQSGIALWSTVIAFGFTMSFLALTAWVFRDPSGFHS